MSRRPKPVDPDDATAWDGFVSGADPGSYLQLSPWAAVKAVNGWSTVRLAAGEGRGQIGAQVLVRRPRPLPWAFAYAPRGPVAADWSPDTVADHVAGFAEACRTTLRAKAGRRQGPDSTGSPGTCGTRGPR